LTTRKIQFKLHPRQLEVFHDKHRFKVVDCGRRWGKTHLAWLTCLVYMLDNPGCLLWWVAPIYKELAPATKKIREITPHEFIEKKYEARNTIRYIRLRNGSECYFHSADREDSMRGSGLHGMVIDEAAQLKENRWHGELEPALIDYGGWCMFIGTPKGKNWFFKLHCRGMDPEQSLYKSWTCSSYDNTIENGGFLNKQDIDVIAADMPETLRRQEIYGVFLEGEGAVFRNLQRQTRKIEGYCQGERLFVGCDLAKHQDFTVLVAVRPNGEVVGVDRFSQLDWVFQQKRIVAFCKRFGSPSLLLDSTGLGDPVFDDLRRQYDNVQGYKLTNQTKKELIENLSVMLDNGDVWLPKENRVLLNELEMFTYSLSPSGLIRYSAPEGYHDDCVIALALAAWQIKKSGPVGGYVVKRW